MEKGKLTQAHSYKVNLEAGKNYAYCTCGLSATQPFCDGSHKSTSFTPQIFSVEETKVYGICGCRHTQKSPFCDGSHKNLDQ